MVCQRSFIAAAVAALGLFAAPAVTCAAPASQAAAAASTTAPAAPLVVLRLKNNSLLAGHVVREDGDSVIFDAGDLGQLTIKKSEIVQQLDPATVAAAFQAATPGPPPVEVGGGNFAARGKISWTRTLGLTGFAMSTPYKLGVLDPRFPGLTGAALRLPGNILQMQSQVSVQRASDHDLWFLEGSDSYTFADNLGKQIDNPVFSGGYNVSFSQSQHVYGVTRYTYQRDGVKQIKYSNQGLFGVGVKVAAGPKVHMDLIPGFALQYDRKGTPFDDKVLIGGGGMEILTWTVRPFSQIEERVLAFDAFNESQYYGLESSVVFKGMITKVVGLTAGLVYTYDNSLGLRPTPIPADALFPGQPAFSVLANERAQATANIGLLIKF